MIKFRSALHLFNDKCTSRTFFFGLLFEWPFKTGFIVAHCLLLLSLCRGYAFHTLIKKVLSEGVLFFLFCFVFFLSFFILLFIQLLFIF